ncbi:MAG: PDZ domain-containing protein [Luteolibacter sp.]
MNVKTTLVVQCFPSLLSLMTASCLSAAPIELPYKAFYDLRSQEFHAREAAESELLAWGRTQHEPAMVELLRQSRVADDPEVRERCMNILRELVTDEYLREGEEGYLGIGMGNVPGPKNIPGQAAPCMAVRINLVVRNSAADKAGLKQNDLIVGLDDKFWHDGSAAQALTAQIRSKKPTMKATFKVLRDEKLIVITAVLGRLPESVKNGQSLSIPEAAERAEKEAYFRRWLNQRQPRE